MTRKTTSTFKFGLLATVLLTLITTASAQPKASTPELGADTPTKPVNDASEINRLESPDGPKIESRYGRSSELTGVLVDRTLSVVGQSFYRAFSQIAMGRPIIRGATLTIHERPDARWGIQVWISERSRVYYRTQLSPRLSVADDYARQATDIVEKAILERRLSASLNPSADLGKEEF